MTINNYQVKTCFKQAQRHTQKWLLSLEHGLTLKTIARALKGAPLKRGIKGYQPLSGVFQVPSAINPRDTVLLRIHRELETGQLCLSVHEEQVKGLVGILSVKAFLRRQMFRSKSVEYPYTVYIC